MTIFITYFDKILFKYCLILVSIASTEQVKKLHLWIVFTDAALFIQNIYP